MEIIVISNKEKKECLVCKCKTDEDFCSEKCEEIFIEEYIKENELLIVNNENQ